MDSFYHLALAGVREVNGSHQHASCFDSETWHWKFNAANDHEVEKTPQFLSARRLSRRGSEAYREITVAMI